MITILIFITINYFLVSPEPKDYPAYLAHSPSPTGVKAFYTLLENETDSVKIWTHQPQFLPNQNDNQLLIMVEPSFIPEQEELDAYQNFMEAGNTIFLFTENPNGMFDAKSEFEYTKEDSNDVSIVYDQTGVKHRGYVNTPERFQVNKQDQVLLYDDVGVIAYEKPYGKGRLIVVNSPQWLTNEMILEEDHLSLVISFINKERPDTILFDDYIHGEEHASNFLTLFPKWYLLILLQGAILVVLWLMRKGKRFGPIFVPREESVRFSDEKIRALAAWYQRCRRYQDSLSIQADYMNLLMQEKWGIPSKKEWREKLDELESKCHSMTRREIEQFLVGLTDVLAKKHISKQEYLLWSKKLDRFRKEVERNESRVNNRTRKI